MSETAAERALAERDYVEGEIDGAVETAKKECERPASRGLGYDFLRLYGQFGRLKKERDNLRSNLRIGVDFWEEYQQTKAQLGEARGLLEVMREDLEAQRRALDEHGGTISIRMGVVSVLKHITTRRIPDFLASLEEHE